MKTITHAYRNGRGAPIAHALKLVAILLGGGAPMYSHAVMPSNIGSAMEYAKSRIIVAPRAGLSPGDFDKILAGYKGKANKMGQSNLYIVDLPANAAVSAVVEQLNRHSQIKFAELDFRVKTSFVPNDPYFGNEWHLAKIGAATAWNTTQGAGVTIAILDSGVDATHQDLVPNMVAGYNLYDNNTDASDVCGHGTAVAGTAAAASNNSVGVAGIAGQAKIMPLRVAYFDSASGACYAYTSTIANGITYAADHGARIANVSYGPLAGNATIQSAAQYMKSKGGLVFVSAGNNGVDENIAPTTTMIPVSATDSNDVMTASTTVDTQIPTSAISAPLANSTVSGLVPVNVNATDNVGVSRVELQVNGSTVAIDSAAPFAFSWNSASVVNGMANLVALAYDAAGNVGTSVPVAVNVSNSTTTIVKDTTPPGVAITNPVAGMVAGTVTVNINASDDSGAAGITQQLFIDGVLKAKATGAMLSYSWNTRKVAAGTHTLMAVAKDLAGNTSSTSVKVTK